MKHITKLAAVFIYIFIMSLFLNFNLSQLLDFKQVCLVLIGMVLLFMPGYRRGESRNTYVNLLSRCALYASYIQTFILLFISLSTKMTRENLTEEIAGNCRPVLYGICLWVIFSNDAETKDSLHAKQPENTLSKVPSADREPMTATEAYAAYRQLGLTNREAELAIQIARGLSNGEIAAELNISETTVKTHVSNIFDKLEINRREQIHEKIKST